MSSTIDMNKASGCLVIAANRAEYWLSANFDEGKTVFGKNADQIIYKQFAYMASAEYDQKPLDLNTLGSLVVFKWLATPKQLEAVNVRIQDHQRDPDDDP